MPNPTATLVIETPYGVDEYTIWGQASQSEVDSLKHLFEQCDYDAYQEALAIAREGGFTIDLHELSGGGGIHRTNIQKGAWA